jgi:hypothetical protein
MVICICGKDLKRFTKGHYLSRQHLEETGQPFFKRKLEPCNDCGKMLYSVTKTHLKSKFHLCGGILQKNKVFLVASDTNASFVPTLDGEEYIEQRTN